MKQTAVEWLVQQLPTIDKYDPYYENLFNQAKAMEKEQIIEALMTSEVELLSWGISAEQYYKETYESNT